MFRKLFGGGPKKIRLEMIDADTGVLLDAEDVPPSALPEEFTSDGKLEKDGKQWSVVDVEPRTAEEYRRTGVVKMKVREIKYMNPKDILMTLPTISDSLPPMGKDAFSNAYYVNMHEDDWRQIEFLPSSWLVNVEKEMEAVRDIYENHSVPVSDNKFRAFRKLHVRKGMENPYNGHSISFDEIKNIIQMDCGSLTFSTSGMKPYGFVNRGFSFQLNERTVIYGALSNDDKVIALGINGELPVELIEVIKNKFYLILVDWVRMEFC